MNGLKHQDVTTFYPFLQSVDWTPEVIEDFKTSAFNATQAYFCLSEHGNVSFSIMVPYIITSLHFNLPTNSSLKGFKVFLHLSVHMRQQIPALEFNH